MLCADALNFEKFKILLFGKEWKNIFLSPYFQIFFDLVRMINKKNPETNKKNKKKKGCVLVWERKNLISVSIMFQSPADLTLPFKSLQHNPDLTTLDKKAFENIVGKRENAGNQLF